MANTVMVFDTLGLPRRTIRTSCIAKRAVRKLRGRAASDGAYCQPCVSPVWDTALACHALMEAGDDRPRRRASGARSTGWPSARSSMWSATGRRRGPGCAPGGWAFQYAQRPLSRRRRHRRRRSGAAPGRRASAIGRRSSARRRMGRSACRARTAAGARSTPTTPTTI